MKYHRNLLRIFCLLVSLLINCHFVSAQMMITGKWKGEDQPDTHVEIYKASDGLFYGKLIYENGKTENLGKDMLKQLKFDKATNTYKGTMTPPDKELLLNVTLSLVDTDKIKLVARKLLLSKTMYFLRIN